MRNAVTLLAFAALSPLCAALPVGVGIDSDQRIRVPIPITKSLLVEPALGWEADRYSYGQTLVKSSGAHIGLGIFYLNATEAQLGTYLGARVWHEQTRASAAENDSGRTKTNGFAPTVGVQYRLTPGFSVAGEIYYSYAKQNSTTTGGFGASISDSSSSKRQKLSGLVILRYSFGGQ